MVNKKSYQQILSEIGENVTLVAVSKMRSVEEIMGMYELGQRDFGENYVQELIEKQLLLPGDIRWHFIGHLQSNKVKYVAPFIHLIHGVERFSLLEEINKQAGKNNRVIDILLQVHIAREETKFGLNENELMELIEQVPKTKSTGELDQIRVSGLMGMGSFSDDHGLVRKEFLYLKSLFDEIKPMLPDQPFNVLSMGMSDDYKIALENGSNMIRIGSLLFGPRAA